MVHVHEREDLQLLAQLEAGVVVADTDGTVVVWNEAAERLLGLPATEAVGRYSLDIVTIAGGGITVVREALAGSDGAKAWQGALEISVRGGPQLPVRAYIQRIRASWLKGGEGYLAACWPVSSAGPRPARPARHMDEAMALFTVMFRRASSPVLLTLLDGTIVEANDAAAALLGCTAEQAVGLSIAAFEEDPTDAEHGQIRRDLLEQGTLTTVVTIRPRTGPAVPAELMRTLVPTSEGDRVFVRVRDVTNERHLQRILDDLGDLARLGDEPRSPREIAQRALDMVAGTFRADASAMLLAVDDATETLYGTATSGPVRAALGLDPAHSPLRAVAERDEPAEIVPASGPEVPQGIARLVALGIAVARTTPIWFGDRRAGSLVLLWREQPSLAFDSRTLGHIGRLAGVAISNAELREQMRREVELRTTLEAPARIGGVVVSQMSDSIVTTDRDHRVTMVNPAAERHFGFTPEEAVGRRLEDLIDFLHPDGSALASDALEEALSVGYWYGRVLQRPRVGSQAGRRLVADLSLTAIRDETRRATGLIAMSRDISSSERLEAEAAALSSLAVATARARGRHEVAAAALERLCEATQAEAGAIAWFEEDGVVFEANRGLGEESLAAVRLATASSFSDTLDDPSKIIFLDDLPTRQGSTVLAALVKDRIVSGLVVGLRVRGQPVGFLGLASRSAGWARPSNEIVLQAASQVANALDNARLMERLEHGLEQERRMTAQLETLMGLTQLPQGAITQESLAQFLLERVVGALEADAGFVVRAAGGDFGIVASYRIPEPISEIIETAEPSFFYFWRRFSGGSNAFFTRIDEAPLPDEASKRLRASGVDSYAAFPIRDGNQLVGAFVCHFLHAARVPISSDARTIEAVGRSIAIAYANIRLGEGLAEAAEHERRLTAELRALQELTLLGAASDDLGTLARETIDAVILATGASGGGYVLVDQATGQPEPIVWVGRPKARRSTSAGPSADAWDSLEPLQSLLADGTVYLSAVRGPGDPDALPGRAAHAALPLRVDDRLSGILQLEWANPPRPEAFDVHFLEPIARIASISLANFRLRSELLERAAAQRALNQRLDALDELTRIGEEASSFEELAHRTANLVREALGATGVCYLLIEPGHHFETHAVAGETGAFRQWLKGVPAKEAPGGSSLLSGTGSVLANFAPGSVHERVLPLARATGFRSFGAIPIRIGEELAGGLLAFFEQPAPTLPLDEAALDSVARIAGIALANFRLRERLVSSEERYRTLFEESPDACFVSALDGTVLDANEAAVKLYAVNRGEVLGRYFGQLVAADEREMARRRQVVWAHGRGSFTDRGRRPNGTEFPCEIEIRVVELGGQRRFLSLVRDLSDQERLQGELLQAQKMEALGQLVSGVAHELNNPLAAIIAFSQLLRGDPRLPDDMKHDAGLLVQEADRTRRIVQNLLDFARQRAPERRRTRVATLVQSVLELQSYALSTNRIVVELDIPETLPEIDLDRAQLQQVLLNLTINAIQAIRSHERSVPAHLWISASLVDEAESDEAAAALEAEGGRVQIVIRDDGPGVPEAARARLFDPFFTTKQPGEGTGLGLSVSFGIVAAHGGHLWYEPGPDEVGSAFVIELPVHAKLAEEQPEPVPVVVVPVPVANQSEPSQRASAGDGVAPDAAAEPAAGDAAPARSEAPAGGPASQAKPCILVLDDEPSIRAFLRKALSVANMDCIPCQDGAQALDALRDHGCDVMLIDHRMAGMSGTEFYDAAVRFRPELASRAVFMSGDVLNPDLRGFATQRGIRLLAKPFDIDSVIRVVREALETSGSAPR